jgi:hypothetical protein
MRVIVTVPLPEACVTGGSRILKTHLFDFFNLAADETNERATVRFGLPKKLQPVLCASNRWGRIKAEVVCAMTSKYAIALYELVQLRSNMDRCLETFTLERFRELLGVPPGAYERGANFIMRVTEPAALEVNGLSDMSVDIKLERSSRFAPITAVTIAWWRKEGDEFRSALRELNRSKVGRMARLKEVAETATPRETLTLPKQMEAG